MSEPGWQQAPVAPRRGPAECAHLGAVFATLGLWRHPEGHEWVCPCGQVFVVVSNAGRDKRLVQDWRNPTAPRPGVVSPREGRRGKA